MNTEVSCLTDFDLYKSMLQGLTNIQKEEMIKCLGGFTKKQVVTMNTQENDFYTNAAENISSN